MLALPFSLVHDEHPELQHVARKNAASGRRLRQAAHRSLPLVVRDPHRLQQFILQKLLRPAGRNRLQHLHGDCRIRLLILERPGSRRDRVAVLQVSLDFPLALQLGGVLEQLLRLSVAEPDSGSHGHCLGQRDAIRSLGEFCGVQFLQKTDRRLVEILHLEEPQLNRPPQGQRSVGLGDRHLVVGVIRAAPAVVGLENQLPPETNQHAVHCARCILALGIALVFDLCGGGQFLGILQDGIGVAPVRPQLAHRNPVLLVFRGNADVGLLQVRKLRLKRPGNILGVEGCDLRGQAIADLSDNGG